MVAPPSIVLLSLSSVSAPSGITVESQSPMPPGATPEGVLGVAGFSGDGDGAGVGVDSVCELPPSYLSMISCKLSRSSSVKPASGGMIGSWIL